MLTDVLDDAAAVRLRSAPAAAEVALLGCGNVGTAVVRMLAGGPPTAARIAGAFVRDSRRRRDLPSPVTLTEDAQSLLARRPAVVLELLGGVEPARSLVLQALGDGIPVVTANKTLLAWHGHELMEAAAASGTPLLYEAAVLAGVPFLGTFARRPHAATLTGLAGIANGTSNFVLTRCSETHQHLAGALDHAQRLGYAEPQPDHDISGLDAAEKLAVLLRQFGRFDVSPQRIETTGIAEIGPLELTHARELGGTVKPVILATWSQRLDAFSGPAFVPADHPLAAVHGVDNALLLDSRHGRLLFQGPGAGPAVTAATILDDVHEILGGGVTPLPREATPAVPRHVETGWMLSISGRRLPPGTSVADLLGSFGVYTRRSTSRSPDEGGGERMGVLTWPVERERLEEGLAALQRAAGCSTSHIRALEYER